MIQLFIEENLAATSNEGVNREIMSEFWVGAYRRNSMKLDFGSAGSITFEHKEDDLWCTHVYNAENDSETTAVFSEEELTNLIESVAADFEAAV